MATKTVKAVVALRKTVWIDNKQFGPGTEISLPADEIEHLRARGFLADPDAEEVPTGEGPSFESADPNAVTVTAS